MRQLIAAVALVLIVFGAANSAIGAATEPRLALVIGNSGDRSLDDLNMAANDAEAAAESLAGRHNLVPDETDSAHKLSKDVKTAAALNSFDGWWIVEIVDLSSGLSQKIDTLITDNQFSASYDTVTFDGQLFGTIDEAGNLSALFTTTTTQLVFVGQVEHRTFMIVYQQGAFEREITVWIPTHQSTAVSRSFRIKLTRAPGDG